MSKNQKTSKNSKTSTATVTNRVGRPKYQPVFPRTAKWTFLDFAEANGVDTKTEKNGKRIMKGTKCTILTLRKFLDRDMYPMDSKNKPDRSNPRRNSLVVLTDELASSVSANKLGRKSFMFQLRVKAQVVKVAKAQVVKAVKTSKTREVSKETQSYEAKKAELLAPTTAVTITPVETAPVVEAVTAPVTTPVETVAPAPVETVTPTPAPVLEAAPVTDPVVA